MLIRRAAATRRPVVALTVLALVLVPLVSVAGPASAAQDAHADIDPSLDGIEVDGDEYRLLAADYERAQATRRQAEAELVALAGRERELAAGLARAAARARLDRLAAVGWRSRLARLVVRRYIGAGDDAASLAAGLDPSYTRRERRSLLASEVEDRWRRALDEAEAELARSRRDRDRLDDEHRGVVADQERTERERARAAAEERRLWPTVAEARATATVVGSDLTLVALDAYLRAAFDMAGEDHGCRLPWWLLAGIGRVESGHGTFATSELDAAGTATPAIIGIALDGGNNTAVITDTDGGALDGDTRSDRAVGPMQFIPSTWAGYESDGNGDGRADPQNIYDAARAASRYLCVASGGLETEAGRRQAVLAYNHSDAYVATVLGFAAEYAGLLT